MGDLKMGKMRAMLDRAFRSQPPAREQKSISARLREFRKQPPPSGKYAKKLSEARKEFFAAHSKLGSPAKRHLKHAPICPGTNLHEFAGFYGERVVPFEEQMQTEGIFTRFSPAINTVLSGDIVFRTSLAKSPLLFIANTKIHSLEGNMPLDMSKSYIGGMQTIDSPFSRRHVCIFLDMLEKMRDYIPIMRFKVPPQILEGPFASDNGDLPIFNGTLPASLASSMKNPIDAAEFMCKFAYHSAKNRGKGNLLDLMAYYTLLHELGHVLLGSKVEASKSSHELFAYAFAISIARLPHLYLGEILSNYTKGGSDPHFRGITHFIERFNPYFGECGGNPLLNFNAVLKYAAASPNEIRAAASGVLKQICKEFSFRLGHSSQNEVHKAERIIFG